MWLCHFVNCHFSTILIVSVCAEQNLIYFVLLPCFNFFFFFFNLVIYLTSFRVIPFFYIFPSICHWGFSQDTQWLLSPKCFSVQNNMEVVKSVGETTYVVELGVGIGRDGESCRSKKGKTNVKERRG